MNSKQAKECMKAVEFLLRLKISQFDQIPFNVLDITQKDFCERRDAAKPYLKGLENALFPLWSDVKKDDEWYVLYNLYQALRYQIFLAENPTSTGVSSWPPRQMTDEPIPDCRFVKLL